MGMNKKLTIQQKIYRKLCVKFEKYIPDTFYLKMLYKVRIGKKLNLKNPITFDEKLQWLKLYDRKDSYTLWADKYEVRSYVAEKLGEQYLIPLLGVWNSTDELKPEDLPEQFVLKCTHDSASVCICKDKITFDWNAAMDKLQKSLNQNYYWHSREWPYKNITPRIIAEAYMTDESGIELKDYKIYTFGGEPYLIQVDFDRFHNHRRNLYTTEWEYIDETIEYSKDPNVKIAKPEHLEEMLECSRKLAAGTISLRTDFYSINGKIYFGEITFYQEAGFAHFEHEEFAKKLGDQIKLPK